MPIIQTDKTLRDRHPQDFYPTSGVVVGAALRRVKPTEGINTILDVGAGTGVWGEVAKRRYFPKAKIVGVELRPVPLNIHYDHWISGDFRLVKIPYEIDLVMGNLPFMYAEPCFKRSVELVKPRKGKIMFLLPLTFLAGQDRRLDIYGEYPPTHVYVLSRRPSFIHEGAKAGKTDNTEYAFYFWDFALPPDEPRIRWVDWQQQ